MSTPGEARSREAQADRDWGADYYGGSDSAHELQELQHDDWFRWNADADEIAERDRRIAAAEQGASDAFDADDRVLMNAFIQERERAFWAMPAEEHTRPHADDAARQSRTDDDADGWY